MLHYGFLLSLGDENDSIVGVANITFVMKTEAKTASFDLENVNRSDEGMYVSSVQDGYRNSTPLQFSHTGGKVVVQLPSAKRNDTCNISIGYAGIPADGLIISKNKFGDRTFFGDNWPNRAHHWLPCVDHPDDKASVEFIVSAPAQYRVIANGTKNEEKDLGGGRWLTRWKEDVPIPTKVMVIGVARFASKTYDDSTAGVRVSAWVYPQDSTKGTYDFAVAPEMVKFFSDYIGPFPYEKLANVQSTTIFGGMENASCIFYDEKLITGDREHEDIVAHEIAHQWFGDAASEKSFADVWLSEGFATYMTNLYWEQKYGKEAMAERLKDDREKVIQFAESSSHPVVDSSENLMALLNANSYEKGGWVLHMLRNEVGDTVFQKIIRAYYSQYKNSNANTRDFEAVAEKVSGKDLKWFFDQWLFRPGVPELKFSIQRTQLETYLIVKQQQEQPYKFNLDLSFDPNRTKSNQPTTVQVKDAVTKVKIPNSARSIRIDPNANVLYDGDSDITARQQNSR